MDVSVIIPTYKEEKRLKATIEKIVGYMEKNDHNYEIIIVDDDSPDNTVGITESFTSEKIKTIKNHARLGKGASIRIGIENASFDTALMTDADLSTPIEELEKLQKFIDFNDIVIGSRKSIGSKLERSQPLKRLFLGRLFTLSTRIFLGLSQNDTQCGFKLFKTNNAKKIFSMQRINGYCFDAELLFIANKLRYKVKEVGIRWIDEPEESKINPLSDGTKMFIDIIKIRLEWMFGFYKRR